MSRFSLEKVWNAKHLSEVEPDFVSKTSFYWYTQNNLQILSDQKTLVGGEYNKEKNHSEIVIEDITSKGEGNSEIRIKLHENKIWNILLDEKNSCMFSGDYDGRVIQFSLDFEENPGKVLKDYGDLGVGYITSSILLGDVAVFGGWNRNLGFIDIQKQEHLGNKFDFAPKYIKSIQLCQVQKTPSQSKTLLTVSGDEYDYSSKTDVLDVTEILPTSFKAKIKQAQASPKMEESKKVKTPNDSQNDDRALQKKIKKENKKLKKKLSKAETEIEDLTQNYKSVKNELKNLKKQIKSQKKINENLMKENKELSESNETIMKTFQFFKTVYMESAIKMLHHTHELVKNDINKKQ